jgi:hypothetical protein
MKLPPVCLLVVALLFIVAVADALFVLCFHTAIRPSEAHVRRLKMDLEPAETALEPPEIDVEPDPEPAESNPDVVIDQDTHQALWPGLNGATVWSVPLEGYLGGTRPPHFLSDADRVYVTHQDGVTALDRRTGKVLWQSRGPNNGLCLGEELLLATGYDPENPRAAGSGRLTARAVTTGQEVFRVRLPTGCEDPEAVQEITGLFLVQKREAPGGQGDSLLIDRKGQVRHRFDRQVITGRLRGDDRVFLTSGDVVCRTPDDKTRWAVTFRDREWIAGGDLLNADGGDLVAYLYGHISDSGVQVLRLNPETGKEVWRTFCSPLGGMHSQYRHEATVRVDGDHLKVTSRGARTFVELLDLQTGARLGRRVVDR